MQKSKCKAMGMMWLIYLSFWLMVEGTLDFQTFVFGGVVSALIVAYGYEKNLTVEKNNLSLVLKTVLWARIGAHFMIDLIRSNIALAKLLLSPKMRLKTQFIEKPQRLKQELHQVLYANSVTLTPGTLTVLCDDEHLLIHCLTDEAKEGILAHRVEADFMMLEGERHA